MCNTYKRTGRKKKGLMKWNARSSLSAVTATCFRSAGSWCSGTACALRLRLVEERLRSLLRSSSSRGLAAVLDKLSTDYQGEERKRAISRHPDSAAGSSQSVHNQNLRSRDMKNNSQ